MATRLLENWWTLALIRLTDEMQSFVEWLKQVVLRVTTVLFHGWMSVNFEFFATVWLGIPSFGCVTLRHWVIVSHWIIDSPLTHWLTHSNGPPWTLIRSSTGVHSSFPFSFSSICSLSAHIILSVVQPSQFAPSQLYAFCLPLQICLLPLFYPLITKCSLTNTDVSPTRRTQKRNTQVTFFRLMVPCILDNGFYSPTW
jgi:hypothetical protein